MRDSYTTVKGISEYRITIKGSEFISCAMSCSSPEDITSNLEYMKEKFPNATHYCYASRYSDIERFSDNGEPSGTAGRPMMQVIRGSGIDDIMVVVVRYFGGTLLGTGGLVQAYTDCAAGAVGLACTVKMVHCNRISIECGYDTYGRFDTVCKDIFIGKPERIFSENVTIISDVPDDNTDDFIKAVNDMTGGNVKISISDKGYRES